jgi:hypothetical protein
MQWCLSAQNIIFLGEIWYADYPILDIVTVCTFSWNIMIVDLLGIEQLKLTFCDYVLVVRGYPLEIIWT